MKPLIKSSKNTKCKMLDSSKLCSMELGELKVGKDGLRQMSIVFPIRIISEANIQCHWTEKHKRNKKNQLIINTALNTIEKPSLPVNIILTRIAPRHLDYDNLVYAQKNILDTICAWLIPNLQAGRADGCKEIKNVEYRQEKRNPREYGLKIQIISLPESEI